MNSLNVYFLILVILPFLLFIIRIVYMAYRNARSVQQLKHQARQAVVDNIQLEAGYPGHQQMVLNDKPPAYDEVMLALAKQQSLEGVPRESGGAVMVPTASSATVETVADINAGALTAPSSANEPQSAVDGSSPPSYEQSNNTQHTHSN